MFLLFTAATTVSPKIGVYNSYLVPLMSSTRMTYSH